MSERWYKRLSYVAILVAFSMMISTLLPHYAITYAAEKEKEKRLVPREIIELRTETSKTFVKPDGKTFITEQYHEPIHYQNEGYWHEIENKITTDQAKILEEELPYTNEANRFKVGFAKTAKAKKLVRFQYGKAQVDFRLVDGANAPASISGNQVAYKSIYPEIDLVYHVGSRGLKEEWVLHKYQDKSTFTMELGLKDVSLDKQKDGSIHFVDAKGNVLFNMPRPLMYDSKDSLSYGVDAQLRKEKNKTFLDIKVDKKWLQDEKRAYPVYIDPSLEMNGDYAIDAFVGSKYPDTNYGSAPYIISGTHPDYGINRSLVKFKLQPLLSGAKITSARLYLNQYINVENQQVNLYPITSSWHYASVTWNNQPTIGAQLSSTVVGEPGEYNWDLTSIAQQWYDGSAKNYGVELRHQVETNNRKSFRSANYSDVSLQPKLVITYTVNPLGKEEFWTTVNADVNTYNGNYFTEQMDIEMDGRGIPLELIRSYNSFANKTGLFGNNWGSNIERRLYDSGDGPVLYVDEDGTTHSFTPDKNGVYITSKALQLELVKNADQTYTMTDKEQNNYVFNASGYLHKMIDANGNTTTIDYSGTLPITVTDSSGRTLNISYDENQLISRITDPANRTIEYGYDGEKNLTAVNTKDSNGNVVSTVKYEYDTNQRMTAEIDANGNRKTIDYDSDGKVNSTSYPITVGGQVQTATTSYSYDPANRLTTVTNAKGIKTLYTHNDYGNVIQVTKDPTGFNYKETYNYDSQNQLISQKDANANAAGTSDTYNYAYDSNGNLTKVTNPLNESTTTEYDSNNNPIKETDANGSTTTNEFDENNNEVSSTDAEEKSSANKYDVYGNLTEETNLMSPGNNLAINGSFEIDRNGDGWPDNWTKVGRDVSTISVASPGLTAEGITLGQKSIKISNPTEDTAVASERVAYNSTKSYVFSGYVKTNNFQGTALLYAFGFNTTAGTYKAIPSSHLTGTHDSTRFHLAVNPGDFPEGTDEIQLRAYVYGGTGEVWFDGLQVEEGFYGAYNVLENGDLERDYDPQDSIPDRWFVAGSTEVSTGVDGLDTTEVHSGKYSMRLVGRADKWKTLRQDIKLAGGVGSILTVSGFSKVENPNPTGGIYGYIIDTYLGTTKQETFTFNFDKSKSHDWQHRTAQIKATKSFDNIKVFYEYSEQAGTAWFDTAKVFVGSITTKYDYDASKNYETKSTNPEGRTVEKTYDTAGNILTEKVGGLHTTSFAYDALNRINQVTDAKSGVTQFEYDPSGNLTKILKANGKATTYVYNELNQLTKETDPLNQSITHEYDILGNETKVTHPNGNTVEYGYDSLDRRTSVAHNGTEVYTFEYDPNGNVTKETNPLTGRITSFEYDADNKLKAAIENGNRIDYGYDKNKNVTERKYTVDSTILTQSNQYNSINQLIGINVNGQDHAKFTYDEANKLASRKHGDGTTTLYTYNGAGDLTEEVIYDRSGNVLDRYVYTYDAKGNITSVINNAGQTMYTYDELDQLTQETMPDGTTIQYTYDSVGNRTSKTVTKDDVVTSYQYSYDDVDQLTSVNGTSYTYDQNGNLLSDGERSFVYDAENRLTAVKDANGNEIASFTYRADGMRKTMATGAETITYHYDENKNVAFETDQNNQLIASYTFEGYRPVSMTRNGQTYYYQLNGHGDVVALTDSAGSVVATYEYDAYGTLIKETGNIENPYRYAGYRYDQATGLYYLQSRYYNPDTGRFLTRDTEIGELEKPVSLNKYAYVHNNPVMMIDPDGHIAWFVVLVWLWRIWQLYDWLRSLYETYRLYKRLRAKGIRGKRLWWHLGRKLIYTKFKIRKVKRMLRAAKRTYHRLKRWYYRWR